MYLGVPQKQAGVVWTDMIAPLIVLLLPETDPPGGPCVSCLVLCKSYVSSKYVSCRGRYKDLLKALLLIII